MKNVSQMDKEYSHILIMADFNYHKINWKQWTSSGDKDAEEFLECFCLADFLAVNFGNTLLLC
jgi:hypothetical protein